MRGDFSTWRTEREYNFNGVLHQQGRVLLDRDWNAQTELTIDWQDDAGQDIVGGGVAGVPADQPDAFKILKADRSGTDIVLDVGPGRIWADGIPVTIHGPSPVKRVATYLGPPIQSPQATKGTIVDNVTRDAVVLEVWREEINGFQLDKLLIEPALGGPDTTERVHTACAFRLYRLAADETCENIVAKLRDKFNDKGKLTVRLQPPMPGGDCDVVIDGGYTGFEHTLYRIEIAQTNTPATPRFKWSQYNGGLVGRGVYKAGKNAIDITMNDQAIYHSGLTQFYLEVVQFDPHPPATVGRGHWRVVYGVPAALDSDGDLQFTGPAVFGGAPPAADQPVFFRLWNEIRNVSEFTATTELVHGVFLAFDTAAADKYIPGDYWTFSMRAGEIPNDIIVMNAKPPEGIHYHRVSLGIVSWNGQMMTFGSGISDCRHIFQPLTRLQTCCTYRVGDGMKSHGDFDNIQKAIDSLPASGGEICILPGLYKENVVIKNRKNITIKGCGTRTKLISAEADAVAQAKPIILVEGSQKITIASLAIEAHANGQGVLLDGEAFMTGANKQPDPEKMLIDITLERLSIDAATRSAIEGHVIFLGAISDCSIRMKDVATLWPAIFITAEDMTVERNWIRVPDKKTVEATAPPPISAIAGTIGHMVIASAGRGGIQIGGMSERVTIVENVIHGGTGSGITLGSLREETDGTVRTFVTTGVATADPCAPGNVIIKTGTVVDEKTVIVSEGDLYEIVIECNDIYDMGLDGIGPVAFFEPGPNAEMIGVRGLRICGNVIRRCLNRAVAEVEPQLATAVAYGGIVLPDVDDLIVRDNIIEGIGFDPSMPSCGIFVLHAEGVEITRNRIWCHPPLRAPQGAGNAKVLKPGIRAGIAFTSTKSATQAQQPFAGEVQTNSDSTEAVVRGNQVSILFGLALRIYAVGGVSVTDNHFETNGTDPSFGFSSTVFIFDLGIYQNILYLLLAFLQSRLPQDRYQYFTCQGGRLVLNQGVPIPPGSTLPNGNVLFADNQCRLDLTRSQAPGAYMSIFIGSLDDIAFHGNQCDCALLNGLVFMNAMLLGMSIRAVDNRFKEGLPNATLSAFTFGMMNMTTMNQADHCLLIRGIPALVEDAPNTVMMQFFCPEVCAPLNETLSAFKKKMPGAN